MRRFIDVVFVQPKSKYYVVLHKGQFWQLPRMNLTRSSWTFKLLYQGSLSDIFVAKDQGLACEQLTQILKTHELPEQLHGMDAHRFLDWWEMYDYKWLSKDDVLELSADSPKETKTPKIPSITTPQTTKAPSTPTPAPAVATVASPPITPTNKSVATPQEAPKPALKTQIHADAILQAKQTAKAQKTQTATQNTLDNGGDDELDIFDALLKQLNEEVIH